MIKKTIYLLILALFIVPAVAALDFTEDFETYNLGGLSPETTPDMDWYTYTDGNEVGVVSNSDIVIAGTQSLNLDGPTGSTASGNKATFTLLSPAQLTEFSFKIAGQTYGDDSVGSRQVISIQSTSPVRTMVEFYLFCADPSNPTGCDLRVRFDNIDTTGQVLVPASAGDKSFNIEIYPDWTTGTYNLFVDAVDDGTFPFLELPPKIGRIQLAQHSTAYPLNMAFDDWFIDGAIEPAETSSGDIADGLKNFATDIKFTSSGSLFMLGLFWLAVLTLAVAVPLVSLGMDNTVLPAIAFFNSLCVLWLVNMEWWPDWVGIALIILVGALVALVIRQLLMGIKDASTNAGIVVGALGYFVITTALLGFSGYATESIELPTSSLETPDDANETVEKQTYLGAIAECAITFFSDCSRTTESTTWAKITDIASSIFNFARTAFTFLFQLLSFSLPIPVIFNLIIVAPPAAALATVGFSFITRSGS